MSESDSPYRRFGTSLERTPDGGFRELFWDGDDPGDGSAPPPPKPLNISNVPRSEVLTRFPRPGPQTSPSPAVVRATWKRWGPLLMGGAALAAVAAVVWMVMD